MKLGIPSRNTNKTIDDYKEDFKLIKEAGFESIDFQSFLNIENDIYKLDDSEFKSFLYEIKNEADKYSLIINQLHTYWECPPVKDYTLDSLKEELVYYVKAIRGAHILNTKYVVIHHRFPFGLEKEINVKNKEDFLKINVEFLRELEPYAKENDVIICLENMPIDTEYSKVDGTIKIIDEVKSEYVKMCLDIGHANVFDDDIYEDIIKINKRLACLHVHDNMYNKDLHLFPYQGNVNWDKVCKGLKEINYKGVFSFETAPSKKLNNKTRLDGLKYLYSIGKELIEKIGEEDV